MKNFVYIAIGILLGLAGSIGFIKMKPALLSANSGTNNILSFVSTVRTTTAVGQAVKVLASNSGRQYCYVQNNSPTAIYLTFKNFDSALAASTSVGVASGSYMLTASSTFECMPDRLVTSDIWASSTVSGLPIQAGQQ